MVTKFKQKRENIYKESNNKIKPKRPKTGDKMLYKLLINHNVNSITSKTLVLKSSKLIFDSLFLFSFLTTSFRLDEVDVR